MRKVNYKTKEILEIEWEDTATAPGWRTQKYLERATPCFCKTVGYFVKQSKNSITLAKSVNDDDSDGLDAQTIPAGCVKRVRRLTKRRKR